MLVTSGDSISQLLVLFAGAFGAAALSGSAGFGGALLLLPMLTHTVGTTWAVPLLTLAQIVGNASRMALGFRAIAWRPVALFLSTGLPGAVLGALCFISIPKSTIIRVIGAAIVVFVLLRLSGRLKFAAGPWTLVTMGALSGFLSGLVGSAGPLGSAVFLSLGLPPMAYIASDATASLLIHTIKTVMYQRHVGLPAHLWSVALLLGVAMILGTWASKRLVESLPPERFRHYVSVLLGIIALQMMIFG